MLLVVVSDINQKSFLFLPVPHLKIKYTFYFSNYNSRLLLMPLLRRKSGIIIGVVSIASAITKLPLCYCRRDRDHPYYNATLLLQKG
jgi:hypothetical protein